MTTEHRDTEATQLLRKEIEAEVSLRSKVASYAAATTVLGLATIIGFVIDIYLILTMSPQFWEYAGPSTVITLGITLMFSTGSTVFFAVSAYYLSKESKPN